MKVKLKFINKFKLKLNYQCCLSITGLVGNLQEKGSVEMVVKSSLDILYNLGSKLGYIRSFRHMAKSWRAFLGILFETDFCLQEHTYFTWSKKKDSLYFCIEK